MIAQFIRDFWIKRNVSSSPDGWYKPQPFKSDDNRAQTYEATTNPPPMELAGSFGVLVAQSPTTGPGSFGAAAFDAQLPGGYGVAPSPDAGLLEQYEYVGGGPLYSSSDSAAEQELQ